eukprot:s3129_g8.t1
MVQTTQQMPAVRVMENRFPQWSEIDSISENWDAPIRQEKLHTELQPLLSILRGEGFRAGGLQADATVMRGYQQARGVETGARRPLPADCPICFEEIVEEKAVEFCKVCGHNVHIDCQRRWASAGKHDTCPMCRSPWGATGGAASAEGVVNLAAYSAEHQEVNLASLYPETHRWIQRRDTS